MVRGEGIRSTSQIKQFLTVIAALYLCIEQHGSAKVPVGYCLKIKINLGSNGQHFKKFFRNFEAQIGKKLRNLRLDHFSEFLIKKK